MDRGAWWATWGRKEPDIAEATEHTHRRQYGELRKSFQEHNPLTVHPLFFLIIMSIFFFFFDLSSMFISLSSNNQTHINQLRLESSSTSTALPLLESLNFNLGLLIASEPLLYW